MTVKKISVSIVLLVLLFSCGVDGDDGTSYVAYSWVGSLQYIYSEDPAFGSIVYNGEYEVASAGTYYMEYIAWDGSGYWVEYTITVEEGEEAGLFTDGEDGDDLYFDIFLASYGPQIYTSSDRDSEKVDNLSVLGEVEMSSEDDSGRVASEGITTTERTTIDEVLGPGGERTEEGLLVREFGDYTIVVRAGRLNQ